MGVIDAFDRSREYSIRRRRGDRSRARGRDRSIDRSIGRSVEVAIERETDRPVRGRTHDAYMVHTVGVYACMRVCVCDACDIGDIGDIGVRTGW